MTADGSAPDPVYAFVCALVDELVRLYRRDIAALDLAHRVFEQAEIGGAERRIRRHRIAAADAERDREPHARGKGFHAERRQPEPEPGTARNT